MSLCFAPVTQAGGLLCDKTLREIRTTLSNPTTEHMTDGIHEKWPVDGYHPEMIWSYDEAFRNLLHFDTLDAFAIARKRTGKSTNVLDLFGSATISRKPYRYDSLTGVRMYPLDLSQVPKGYASPRWAEIVGDIFSPKTWQKIDARRASTSIDGFDLILIRPMGPLTRTTRIYVEGGLDFQTRGYLALLGRVLDRALAVLSRDGGICLVEIPPAIEVTQYFKSWLQRIEQLGYSTQFDDDLDKSVLKLVKHAK